MRVSLFYNEGAGQGTSFQAIREELERNGHELVQTVTMSSDVEPLAESAEVVVAAGGDGTVSVVARAVAGLDIPVAILPLGTANNIARSLGIDGSISSLIGNWGNACRRPFDLGVARGRSGEGRFVEAVGGGLISAGIIAMRQLDDAQESSPSRLSRALRKYREILSRLETRPWTLTLDGTRQTKELLVLEVLNIGSIGPNVVLSPDVDSSDGSFSVVAAGEEHRHELAEYLQHRLEGTDYDLCLPVWKARRIEIETPGDIHVDDEIHSGAAMGTVSLEIEPAAVRFLVPPRG